MALIPACWDWDSLGMEGIIPFSKPEESSEVCTVKTKWSGFAGSPLFKCTCTTIARICCLFCIFVVSSHVFTFPDVWLQAIVSIFTVVLISIPDLQQVFGQIVCLGLNGSHFTTLLHSKRDVAWMPVGAVTPRKTYSDVTRSTLRPWVSLQVFIMSKSYLLNRGDTVDYRAGGCSKDEVVCGEQKMSFLFWI